MNSHRMAKNLLRKVYRQRGAMSWDIDEWRPVENEPGASQMFVKCSKCGHKSGSLLDTCPSCGRIWDCILK